jgi:hypothetical protein
LGLPSILAANWPEAADDLLSSPTAGGGLSADLTDTVSTGLSLGGSDAFRKGFFFAFAMNRC